MTDKDQPTAAIVAQPEVTLDHGATSGTASSASGPNATAPTEEAARSASVSPQLANAEIIRNSPLAGRPRASTPPQAQSLSPEPNIPVPETHTANADVDAEPRDAQIADLKAMFPDYDDAILQSVLQSVEGNQNRAVDVLLGMSDPNFTSEAEQPQAQEVPLTQEELDEQLARRLYLGGGGQRQQWQVRHQRPHRRSSRSQGAAQQVQSAPAQSPGGRDTVSDFQEQFSKIAETGKETFGALVSKVKAKLQDLDKPSQDSGGSGVQPTWSSSAAAYHDPNATNYQPYRGHYTPPGLSNPAAAGVQQQPAFYDPNMRSSPSTQYTSPNVSGGQAQSSSLVVEGYDVTPLPSSTGPPQLTQPTPSAAASGTVGTNPSSSNAPSPPPRGPSPAIPIDGGKLGLLPKRPISLIRDPPQTQPQEPQRQRTEDDNDLEYAESPFEDPRK